MRNRRRTACAAAVAVLLSAGALLADFSGSYLVPLDHKAIQYATAPADNCVSSLSERIARGDVSLTYNEEHGYLESLLKQLRVPVSSQVLVFSKTSFQASRIAPRTPRALYHTEDVSVGYVIGGDVLEIAAVDPRLGAVFYTLDQEKTAKPKIERRGDCLQCHAGNATLGVPGLMVRSLHVETSGMPIFNAPSFVTDHRSPISQRWGGWYVTGKHGSQTHMGNLVVQDKARPEALDRARGKLRAIGQNLGTTPPTFSLTLQVVNGTSVTTLAQFQAAGVLAVPLHTPPGPPTVLDVDIDSPLIEGAAHFFG